MFYVYLWLSVGMAWILVSEAWYYKPTLNDVDFLHELSKKQEQHSDMKSKVCFHLLYVAEMDPYHLLWIIKFHSQKKVSCAETIDISAEHLAISKWCFWDKMQERDRKSVV